MKDSTIITIRYEIGTDGIEVGKSSLRSWGYPITAMTSWQI